MSAASRVLAVSSVAAAASWQASAFLQSASAGSQALRGAPAQQTVNTEGTLRAASTPCTSWTTVAAIGAVSAATAAGVQRASARAAASTKAANRRQGGGYLVPPQTGITGVVQPTKAAGSTTGCESRVAMAARGGGGKKKILVMGGTRFIGCYLVKQLRDEGHDVFVMNRGKTNGGKPEPLPGMSDAEYEKMLEGVSVLVADRKDPEQVKKVCAEAGHFDVVYDNNARKLEDVQILVDAIEATGGCDQFIFMSSAGVYGPTQVLPLNEATPGDPNSRHKEKLSCENLLDSKGYNWTSIRPVYIYGPLNYNPVERYFFDRVARGKPICIPYDGMYITQLGHCEDLANFMTLCIGNPKVAKQVYNISGEEYVTFDGMAKLCAEAAGVSDVDIVHYDPKVLKSVDVPEDYPKAFPFRGMHFFASIEKAKTDIPEWTPKYTFLEGLKASYKEDYCGRGFDKKDPDYRMDDLIIKTVKGA
eukprot:TRINITY_DN1720_c0_g1_i3.p2 TRINITY_DN1720_c0_g1~~TRINITY_DN1720_c0_g1_i3.p2  ORF type:complete len:475 (+),score=123.45 TRINITY_DN1720_c0_g1_i3:123-1547(+)